MKVRGRSKSPLRKRAKRGFRGYPLASVCFYGATAERASKVVVGITKDEGAEVDPLERWVSDNSDVRSDEGIGHAILEFIKEQGVKTVVMSDGLLGCPHEEGIDYPEGASCPSCPYWAGRNRFTGEMEH
jgi:hypothetical protein